MTVKSLALGAAAALALAGSTAQAAMIVHDPTSYAKLVAQAKTALDQLKELQAEVAQGKALYESLNTGSLVGAIAPELAAPELRDLLPDAAALAAAARGDLAALGKIGARADEIRAAGRLYTPPEGDAAGAALEARGDSAARDLAIAEAVGEAGARRLAGLSALGSAIDEAQSARAVLDLQARAQVEGALIANDQMRLQSLAMAQAAEARLAAQRDLERARARSAARMALYRRSFE